MSHALFWLRSLTAFAARVLAVAGLATVLFSSAHAQTIDLKLNVFYEIPGNVNSGGTWELVARTDTEGIAGINVRLSNINSGSVLYHGPRGKVNGTDNAGFWINTNSAIVGAPTARKIGTSQNPLASLDPGEEQTLFYGVGSYANGAPRWPDRPLGTTTSPPDFATLTNVQNVPWATPALGDEEWPTAALFMSGTFADGVTPSFYAGEASTGQVFTALPPDNQTFINPVEATVTTIVDTSPGALSPDYNGDGFIDVLDYIVWRMNPAASGGDPQGYENWAANYGQPAGSGSVASGNAVPEPASAALLILSSLLGIAARTRKKKEK